MDKNITTAYHETYKRDGGTLTIAQYRAVLNCFFKTVVQYLYEGMQVILPYSFGSLFIIGKSYKLKRFENGQYNLPIDWPETYKLWNSCQVCKDNKQYIYYTNEHTNGVVYKPKFSIANMHYRFREMYNFKFNRDFKRDLAKLIKSGKTFYTKL